MKPWLHLQILIKQLKRINFWTNLFIWKVKQLGCEIRILWKTKIGGCHSKKQKYIAIYHFQNKFLYSIFPIESLIQNTYLLITVFIVQLISIWPSINFCINHKCQQNWLPHFYNQTLLAEICINLACTSYFSLLHRNWICPPLSIRNELQTAGWRPFTM